MSHDVFICYDPNDEEISNDISDLLELNDIKTWIKNRDLKETDTVFDISNAIRDSKCFILVYSNSAKESNFVSTEIDFAFSSEIPILIFKIDDAEIDDKLAFYLKDKPTIEAPNPKEKYNELLNGTLSLLNRTDEPKQALNSISDVPLGKQAYICYDEADENVADAICKTLESNKIKCWIKNRNLDVNDTVFDVKENLEASDVVVLVHSSNSEKSNYVKTETDIAITDNIPIIIYKIDKYTVNSNLKEYAGENRLIAHPDVNSELENLVKKTSEILKQTPVKKPAVQKIPEAKKEVIEDETPIKESKTKAKKESKGFFNKKVIAAIIIIAIVAVVGVFASGILNSDSNGSSSSDGVIFGSGSSDSSDDPRVEGNDTDKSYYTGKSSSSGVTILNINFEDDGDSLPYHYFVWGTLGSDLKNLDQYKINVDFYDSSGTLIGSYTEDVKDLEKAVDEYLLGYIFTGNKDMKKIVVSVTENGNEVGHDEYEL